MEDDSGAALCPKCGRPFDLQPKNSLQLKPRTLLRDQYLIGRALGHGGFGITYLAWDLGLESRLAVKEYMPNGVAGRATGDTRVLAYSEQTTQEFEWGLDRFLEEARVLKRFSNHPGIVAVDTIFRDNGTAYLVMEYLDGVTFEEFLARRDGKVSFETALRVMLPVIDALCAVHAESILHRDISPDNIYLTRNGKVKLIDFGAARNALSQKSRNLSIILKEGYAPEEQYRASGIQGPWTDVYATAATMYHAVTGQVPQPALDRQAEDKLKRPRDLGIEIEPRAEAALMKALNIRAADRFPSMEDFKSALTGNIDVAGATKQIDRNDPRIQALERAAQAEAVAARPAAPPPGIGPTVPIRNEPPPLGATAPYRGQAPIPPVPPMAPALPMYLPPQPVASVTPARQKWLWPAILGAVAVVAIAAVVLKKPDPNNNRTDTTQKTEAPRTDNTDRPVRTDNTDRPVRTDNTDRPVRTDNTDRPVRTDNTDRPVRTDNTDRPKVRTDNTDRPAVRTDNTNRPIRTDIPGVRTDIPGVRTDVPGVRTDVPGVRTDVPGIRTDLPGVRTNLPGVRTDLSGIRRGITDRPQIPRDFPGGGAIPPGPQTPSYESLTQQAAALMQRKDSRNAYGLLIQATEARPADPRAYNQLGELLLYQVGNFAEARKYYEMAVARGGVATFHVSHDHGIGNFINRCSGVLNVSRNRVTFQGDNSMHNFDVPRAQVKEMKKNRSLFTIGAQRVTSFRIRLEDGKNFNLSPMSNFSEGERDLILSLAGGN